VRAGVVEFSSRIDISYFSKCVNASRNPSICRDDASPFLARPFWNSTCLTETFQAAVPANTAVWDKRGGVTRVRAAIEPVSDIFTLFEK
jgi:hypothetical protein